MASMRDIFYIAQKHCSVPLHAFNMHNETNVT